MILLEVPSCTRYGYHRNWKSNGAWPLPDAFAVTGEYVETYRHNFIVHAQVAVVRGSTVSVQRGRISGSSQGGYALESPGSPPVRLQRQRQYLVSPAGKMRHHLDYLDMPPTFGHTNNPLRFFSPLLLDSLLANTPEEGYVIIDLNRHEAKPFCPPGMTGKSGHGTVSGDGLTVCLAEKDQITVIDNPFAD